MLIMMIWSYLVISSTVDADSGEYCLAAKI